MKQIPHAVFDEVLLRWSLDKPGYVVSLVVLAIFLTLPQAFVCWSLVEEAIRNRGLPMFVPGLSQVIDHNTELGECSLWNGEFVYIDRRGSVRGYPIWSLDPQTGETKDTGLTFQPREGEFLVAFGGRLWHAGCSELFELTGDQFTRHAVPTPGGSYPFRPFLYEDRLAFFKSTPGNAPVVHSFHTSQWQAEGEVVLPDGVSDCRILGATNHVFAMEGSKLIHREGLVLQPFRSWESRVRDALSAPPNEAEPVSALLPSNRSSEAAGWQSVVSDVPKPPNGWWDTLMVDGEPGVLIVDASRPDRVVASAVRREGARWLKFASCELPLGTIWCHVVPALDRSKSYVIAVTGLYSTHILEIDDNGIRPTVIRRIGDEGIRSLDVVAGMASLPVLFLCFGLILAAGTTGLMRRFTNPMYGSGRQTVRMASVWRRGVARVIDLGLIAVTTLFLGWLLTRTLDWSSFVEALNLRIYHPTVARAVWAATWMNVWLIAAYAVLVAMQARWGLTPGKWLCGLRTLRTTLKQCGFARSLVREVVLSVDACHFLCWTPGIVCIALTDCRQRLGDLVADTIVVEAASLKPGTGAR